MPANYDKIAGIYDLLSRLIFGRQIVRAQVCMLPYVPDGSNILIVGGGTGWILEKLSEEYPRGLEIDYVESSARMVALSRARDSKANKVNFLTLPVEDFASQKQYDVIITPFILDNFQREKIGFVFDKLDACLRSKGLWLYADFVNHRADSPLWQRFLLRVMYLFFRITCGIETQELIDMDPYFAGPYLSEFEMFHYFGFIRSAVYRKIQSSPKPSPEEGV